MSETTERRNPKVPRVELATLVDICARDTNLPPFQGQSGNISGRGMQVRTGYLPEIGTPLVCRFEHDAREVLVEGKVAWRSEGEDGGEFGVQFTAVDADSAEILRSLRPMSSVASAFKPRLHLRPSDDDESDDDELLLKSGDRVRLHIDGLASPMKAAVHESTRQKVRLGSSLEFLKVGRPVEIENVGDGERRGAKVDSVNVVLNPSTSVPELVVMLRYEGDGGSPLPAVTQDLDHERKHLDEDRDDDDQSALSDATDMLKSKVLDALGKAHGALFWAKDAARKVGHETKRTVQVAREKMQEQAEEERAARPKVLRAQTARRTTVPPRPSNVARAGFGAKRAPVSTSDRNRTSAPAPRANAKPNRTAIVGGVALLGVIALGTWMTKGRSEPALSHVRPAEAPTAATATPAVAPAPAAATPAAPAPSAPKSTPDGIVAEVPLFGPRAIATTEPLAKPEQSEALLEKRAAAASVPDEKFPESSRATGSEPATTWGRGQLNLPTVHRIRLDAAGSEVVGVAEPNGFAVVIPGRKAMETGRTIEKRDRRILHVKTSNTAEGARINFAFRGPVPPYRVRLKNDFIEFFVSAPEGVQAEP